jgi:hypothetical protein
VRRGFKSFRFQSCCAWKNPGGCTRILPQYESFWVSKHVWLGFVCKKLPKKCVPYKNKGFLPQKNWCVTNFVYETRLGMKLPGASVSLTCVWEKVLHGRVCARTLFEWKVFCASVCKNFCVKLMYEKLRYTIFFAFSVKPSVCKKI